MLRPAGQGTGSVERDSRQRRIRVGGDPAVATGTERLESQSGTVQRYGRAGRWFHAGIYLTVLIALATGWWFVLDGYRNDSPLARLLTMPDEVVHEFAGYGAAAAF